MLIWVYRIVIVMSVCRASSLALALAKQAPFRSNSAIWERVRSADMSNTTVSLLIPWSAANSKSRAVV